MNITLSVPDPVVTAVRRLALDRGTTITQLMRDHLTQLAQSELARRALELDALDATFLQVPPATGSGGRRVGRDDLHDR